MSTPAPYRSASPKRFDPLSYLECNAARDPDGLAVLDDGLEISFDALLGATEAAMIDLRGRGVQAGDVVVVALANVWSYVSLEIAVPSLGAVILPLPIQLGQREVASAIERSGAAMVISDSSKCGEGVLETGRAIPSVRVVAAVDELTWSARRGSVAPAGARSTDPARIVQIAPTSGTTGLPKLASLSAELKQLTFEGFTSRLRIGRRDRVLPMSPIAQGVGEMCLYALRTGATLVMSHEQRFDSDRILSLVESSGATIIAGVPTMIGRLLNSRSLDSTELGPLRGTLSAGSPLAPTLAEAWERRSDSSTGSFYGAMDIGQLAVPSLEDPPEKRWTTVGRPHDRAEYLICDRNGRSVPVGATGEICMRGPLVQQRYWGEGAGPFAEDGWAHFGDLGFVDEDGYLHVTGRIKDIIIRGGNNINPQEVEEIIRRVPGILDACVVGCPDADLGERAVAFVVCERGTVPSVSELHAFLEREGVTRYKWPEALTALEQLPVRGTGKVDRAGLKAKAADMSAPHDGTEEVLAC